jgi:hypothetical protein
MSKMADIDITIQDIQQLLANEPHATQVYILEAVLLQVKLRIQACELEGMTLS